MRRSHFAAPGLSFLTCERDKMMFSSFPLIFNKVLSQYYTELIVLKINCRKKIMRWGLRMWEGMKPSTQLETEWGGLGQTEKSPWGAQAWRMPEGTMSCLHSPKDHFCLPKPQWRILYSLWMVEVPPWPVCLLGEGLQRRNWGQEEPTPWQFPTHQGWGPQLCLECL